MSPGRLALLAQVATTLPLVGLIWTVQVVQYPLFARVGDATFRAFHAMHAQRITFVVAPLMVGELVAALASVALADRAFPRELAWVGAALAVSTWATTFLFSVPAHEALAGGFDADVHARLVATNLLRTAAWTARGVLLLGVVARAL